MKLIITGASGFVASEIIRQSLRLKEITTVIALARKPIAPSGLSDEEAAKLRSVVTESYETYSPDVQREFANADACIWTVAVTPGAAKRLEFDEVKRVCQTYTLAGFRAMMQAGPAKPFRFLYMSGSHGERDQTKRPFLMTDYALMRGETENQVLAFAASQPEGSVQACVAKPGIVTDGSAVRSAMAAVARLTNVVSYISVEELAAAMLSQIVLPPGFEKEPLTNDDLKRIGRAVLDKKTGGT